MPRNNYTNTVFPSSYINKLGGVLLNKQIAQSYAAATFDLKEDIDGGPRKPEHIINILSPATGQFIPITVLSDTGNDVTLLTEDMAPLLGFNLNQPDSELNVQGVGGSQRKAFYAFNATMKIGELRPIQTKIAFGPTPKNLLGRESAMGGYSVTYTPNSVMYTETSSGYENASESYYNQMRNAPLYGSQGSRSLSGYRNRL